MRATKGLSEMSPSKVSDEVVGLEKSTSPTGRRRWSSVGERDHLAHERVARRRAARSSSRSVDRLEDAGLEVDDVDLLRASSARPPRGSTLTRRPGWPGADEDRVVVGQAVDRARARARARCRSRPSSRLIRGDQRNSLFEKRHPGEGGQPVAARPACPTTSWIRMPISSCRSRRPRSRAVLDGVGAEDRGVHLGDRVGERGQALALGARGWRGRGSCTCPRRRRPARSSSRLELRTMMGRPSRSSSTSREPSQDVRGEERVLEELDDVGVVEADPVDVGVLAVVDVLEVVVVDEVEDAVRGDVPARAGCGCRRARPGTRASGPRSCEARKRPAALPPRRPWLRGG